MQGTKAFSTDMIRTYFPPEEEAWLTQKVEETLSGSPGNLLFLNYSLLSDRYRAYKGINRNEGLPQAGPNSAVQAITPLELARIYLLSRVLNEDPVQFIPKVRQLIQVADKEELRTFLKYLSVLPHPAEFTTVAVEAVRTNIATVFDAIALDNPYPAAHFNEDQWNQMFLKAAFMQRPLYRILGIEKRANANLARIIADYAHERWAASREVDPFIWRPVGPFLNAGLLRDMEKLLKSEDSNENIAGLLCLKASTQPEAARMLEKYLEEKKHISGKPLNWAQVKV